MSNELISITGPSGVGKTTMAKLISSILDYGSSVIISGDDSHKWERNDPHWEIYTHLNPSANNLEVEFDQLSKLKNNQSINRRAYNHETGKFDESKIIEPKKFIIYEGLHSFLDENLKNLSNLKIYVDTDEDLKIAWKLKRDISKRGYTEAQVLDHIKRRLVDEQQYIIPQKEYADVIVKFVLTETGVQFLYELKNKNYESFFQKISNFYKKKVDFLRVCEQLASDEELTQNKGGNVSFKYDDKILITSSGAQFKDVHTFENFCICSVENSKNILFKHGRPSMELSVHSKMKGHVVHTHPVHILSILCCKNFNEIIQNLFCNYDYDIIPYITPGKKLSDYFENVKKDIVFCQNHGLFVSSNNLIYSLSLTKELNDIAKNYIESFGETQSNFACGHLFPDSAVLPELNRQTNQTLYDNIMRIKQEPNYLSQDDENELLQMEEEKYRRI